MRLSFIRVILIGVCVVFTLCGLYYSFFKLLRATTGTVLLSSRNARTIQKEATVVNRSTLFPSRNGTTVQEDTRVDNPARMIAIIIPSRPGGMCKNGARIAEFSVNAQTLKPSRVILGISSPNNLTVLEQNCIDQFKKLLRVPLTVVHVLLRPGSAGASRNAALDLLRPEEGVLMHDDDEYIHPQAIEYLSWAFDQEGQSDVFTFAYLWQWRGSPTPWCINRNFSALHYTTNVKKDQKSSNLAPAFKSHSPSGQLVPTQCSAVHHAYPGFRSSPTTKFGVRYTDDPNGHEDGTFLQDLVDKGARMRHSCFPVMAYRSANPTSTNTTDNKQCGCFEGFSRCPP